MAENIEYTTTGKPHPYHLVRPSIWPFMGAMAGGLLAVGTLMYLHEPLSDIKDGVQEGMEFGLNGIYVGLVAVLLVMFFWWKDVIYESVVEKAHTRIAEVGLRFGMALFILALPIFTRDATPGIFLASGFSLST